MLYRLYLLYIKRAFCRLSKPSPIDVINDVLWGQDRVSNGILILLNLITKFRVSSNFISHISQTSGFMSNVCRAIVSVVRPGITVMSNPSLTSPYNYSTGQLHPNNVTQRYRSGSLGTWTWGNTETGFCVMGAFIEESYRYQSMFCAPLTHDRRVLRVVMYDHAIFISYISPLCIYFSA